MDGVNLSIKAGSPLSFCKIQGEKISSESEHHARGCLSQVRESIQFLTSHGKLSEIRIVIGDGLNNTETEMSEIVEFLQSCGLMDTLDVMPHPPPVIQICQFRSIGVSPPYCDTIRSPSLETLHHWKDYFSLRLPGVYVSVQTHQGTE